MLDFSYTTVLDSSYTTVLDSTYTTTVLESSYTTTVLESSYEYTTVLECLASYVMPKSDLVYQPIVLNWGLFSFLAMLINNKYIWCLDFRSSINNIGRAMLTGYVTLYIVTISFFCDSAVTNGTVCVFFNAFYSVLSGNNSFPL